jgi:uncharacterized membrane protein (Fun14 family)
MEDTPRKTKLVTVSLFKLSPYPNKLYSAGGGFLFGAVAGYAIKKVMKIAAVIVGLFVAGLAFLSYKGWIDVKWTTMER